MPWTATVFNIVIASPSDVPEERQLIADLIHRWNFTHGMARAIMLEPVRWETHTHPELGDRPQSIINSQIIDGADILVGLFWTRLGTDTGVAPSGTAEEIQRFEEAGKSVALYFSDRAVSPRNLDASEYQRLRDFRSEIEKRGLYSSFSDLPDLERKFNAHLASFMNDVAVPAKANRAQRTPKPKPNDRGAMLKTALRNANDKPVVQGSRYTRNDIITDRGDIRILETWENVTSYSGDPVFEIPVGLKSRAGRQANWRCQTLEDPHSGRVKWLWSTAANGISTGRFVFDPPLTIQTCFVCDRTLRLEWGGVYSIGTT